jgi:putative two-component system response regulator
MVRVEMAAPGRQCVLVVDDRPLNVELITAYLEEIDCHVEVARDGLEALQAVKTVRPDLVLLDVMMPGMDGFEVCSRIKSHPETRLLPVVLVTALGNTADRIRGLEAGADDFIVKPVERLELVARARSLLRLKGLYDKLDDAERVIFSLARAVEAKDGATESHTERVAQNAQELGIAAGIQGPILADLYRGGLIHDIGKIGVPDAILQKPGPLSPVESDLMRRHVLVGEQIVRPLHSAQSLLPIIRSHHERIDGRGYPDEMAGTEIPMPARIVAICDAFDALTTHRAYRPGRSLIAAAGVLQAGAGTQWDADLVQLFVHEVLKLEPQSV